MLKPWSIPVIFLNHSPTYLVAYHVPKLFLVLRCDANQTPRQLLYSHIILHSSRHWEVKNSMGPYWFIYRHVITRWNHASCMCARVYIGMWHIYKGNETMWILSQQNGKCIYSSINKTHPPFKYYGLYSINTLVFDTYSEKDKTNIIWPSKAWLFLCINSCSTS